MITLFLRLTFSLCCHSLCWRYLSDANIAREVAVTRREFLGGKLPLKCASKKAYSWKIFPKRTTFHTSKHMNFFKIYFLKVGNALLQGTPETACAQKQANIYAIWFNWVMEYAVHALKVFRNLFHVKTNAGCLKLDYSPRHSFKVDFFARLATFGS